MPEQQSTRPHSHNLFDLAPPDLQWFLVRSDIVLVPIGSLTPYHSVSAAVTRTSIGAAGHSRTLSSTQARTAAPTPRRWPRCSTNRASSSRSRTRAST